jgi:hypothetical protein
MPHAHNKQRVTNVPTKLTYNLTTDPFPLQANTTATLTVVASNPAPKTEAILVGVSITIPIGPNGSDLMAAGALRVEAPDEKWLVEDHPAEGMIEYVFTPPSEQVIVGEQGLAFTFVIKINMEPGTCTIKIKEGIKDKPTNSGTATVSKFPQGWGQVNFTVNPPNIKAGDKTELSWLGPEKATYTIDYFVPGTEEPVHIPAPDQKALSNDGKYPGKTDPPLTPEATTTFTLTVTMAIGTRTYAAQQQKVVTVKPRPPVPPSIKYFRPRGCETSDCVIYADQFVLEWKIENALRSQCQLTERDVTQPGKPAKILLIDWEENFLVVKPTTEKMRYTMTIDNKTEMITSTVTATLVPAVPVGTIVAFGARVANQLPPGWLYCNGGEYSKNEYPQLWTAITDLYGSSRSADKGVLPDLRGYFIRGYDDKRGVDPDRQMGTTQGDSFGKHTHGQKVTANAGKGSAIRMDFREDIMGLGEYDQGVQTFATGESETRPKNLACYYVIYAGLNKPPGVAGDDEADEPDETTTES